MRTFFEAVAAHARRDPDRHLFTDGGGSLSRAGLMADAARLAEQIPETIRVIGIHASSGRPWAVAQLACVVSGRVAVPLPTFFSAQQLAHILRDAGVEMVLAENVGDALPAGIACLPIAVTGQGGEMPAFREGFGTVIYTSGSTGQPKGVRHMSGQLAWSTAALAEATRASEDDSYLSVLPLSLLLESLCAVFIPAFVGGRAHFATELSEAVGRGAPAGLAAAFELHRPTTGVVVPELLRVWVAELLAHRRRAPDSMRFVAVGGAPVPPRLAELAWQLGIPVHEGYGLSECCSVVALNRPGARVPGTVGEPLPGLSVSIREGEILVEGPSVSDGYLGGRPAMHPWATGDIGALGDGGRLTVFGRKDNVVCTQLGRNVSPEWVETAILDDPGVAFCAVAESGAGLAALVVPTPAASGWFADAGARAVEDRIATRCAQLPAYARPGHVKVLSLAEAKGQSLITANGRIRRQAARVLLSSPDDPTLRAAPSPHAQGLEP
ncbi:AMP-binding protein [Xanthobacter autotrophicus DSM 431]|uniref:AMP-binding protein n=1 Tax=Xanthobacter nonsaccharivorans TaxID=3119912 RepID=UPI00372724C0